MHLDIKYDKNKEVNNQHSNKQSMDMKLKQPCPNLGIIT